MIKVANLCKSYGSHTLFDDVSFNVNPRERIGLVGRNGHGKTTLFRLVLKREEPDSGLISISKNYRIGHLEQHIHFTKPTVLDEACVGLSEGQEHDAWRAESILFGLGFTKEDMARPPQEFSGGFQVRMNLAKVLVSDPDLLLLDEPTNYLDILSIRWLIKFLQTWPRELMLITHDRSFMDSVITHTLGIHRQRVRKIEGRTDKFYDQILQDEEIYEKTRMNDEKRRKEVEVFIRRFRAKARLANMVQSRIKTLAKSEKREKLEKIRTIEFDFNAAPFPAKILMEVDGAAYTYDSTLPKLFDDVKFTIGPNDRICVVGKNGKGKSTLLKVLAQRLEPVAGQIRTHAALRTGYFGQTNVAELDLSKTVEEEIMTADANCTQQRARDIAGSMMFTGADALKKISVLSGGERSRVLLGKILVSPCNLLLLDEPSNHLDMESCDSLLAALDSFDGAVVLVTHNELFLDALADRLLIFDRGKVTLYEGRYRDFLHDVGWENEDAEATKTLEESNLKSQQFAPPDKKALRKARAEIIQQKSHTLGPLKKRISKLEKEIEKRETERNEVNQLLISASIKGDGQAIATLVKQDRELKAGVDKLYEELATLTEEYESKSRNFEDMLSAV
jgi:ATP-binding cassette subfamily F protein 3